MPVEAIVPPENPVGPYQPGVPYSEAEKNDLFEIIRLAPSELRRAVTGLSDPQLDTLYKNWTIRQIADHLADSAAHSYIRCKFALVEDVPTIKPYHEGDWVDVADSPSGDLEPALALMEGVHARFLKLLRGMSREQFLRAYYHPEKNGAIRIWDYLYYFTWHCRHHTGQILWLRSQKGW